MPHRAPDTKSLQALLEVHDEPVVLIDSEYTIVAVNSAYVESYASPGPAYLATSVTESHICRKCLATSAVKIARSNG